MDNMTNTVVDNDYASRYSKHGYGVDVRQTYAHLPAEWFWTLLTGKDHRDLEPRKPKETLLSPLQLCLQILYSWPMIAIFVYLGYWALSQELKEEKINVAFVLFPHGLYRLERDGG